jgi:CRP/FNR family transcriptional regulator
LGLRLPQFSQAKASKKSGERAMLQFLTSAPADDSRSRSDAIQGDVHWALQPVRSLAPGKFLFQAGDRCGEIYRVERGSLCHYIRWRHGHHEIIEFVFPGAFIGFGHIAKHVSAAKAMLHTEISIVTPREFECALRTDGQLAARVAAAADREVDCLRFGAIQAARGKPTVRLAAYLAALSHMSAREGRDATLIPEEIPSGIVAEELHMSIDCLTSALRQLQDWGLVLVSAAGLHIIDIPVLERLADANSLPHSPRSRLEVSDI